METSPKPRGRPRSFDLDAVAAKAAILFWRHGYEGVSVDELTTAMGITTQSFYAAFGSKERLHRAALDWYDREVTRLVRDAVVSEDDIAAAIRAALRLSAREFTRPERPAGCLRSTAGICSAHVNESVARHATALRRETTSFIAARLDQGVVDQQLASDTDTKALALYFSSTVVGMSVAALDGASTDELLAVADLAAATLQAKQTRKMH